MSYKQNPNVCRIITYNMGRWGDKIPETRDRKELCCDECKKYDNKGNWTGYTGNCPNHDTNRYTWEEMDKWLLEKHKAVDAVIENHKLKFIK